jgi:eukaryotic-like serine/threonine-protein kinase
MVAPDPLGLVGTTVSEKYEIERVVGEGGFALVYRATHKVWNRAVALKVFRALGDLPHDRRDQLVQSFIQEGALLAELSERSAAICQARDIGMLTSSDGRAMPYMVLEWLEGMSLEEVIESEKAKGMPPRTPGEALQILEPAAEALALAHRKGIAHRDVKPANLFVLGDPRGEFTVKLLDFGIAKVVQDVQRMGGAFAQTQGVVSSFTPAYGAPEQFSRSYGATGPWTDVFALALMFTELCTHEAPLQGDDLTQLAFATIDPNRRPTPRAFGLTIPDALEEVLRKALAVSPTERFQSTGEMWEALRGALAMEPMRGFIATSPGMSQPQVATQPPAGAPSGPLHVGPGSVGPNTPRGVAGPRTTDPHIDTMVAVPAGAGRTRSPLALFAAIGAVVTVVAALVIVGVWAFAIRGRDATAPPVVGEDAAAVAAGAEAAGAAPAPPSCPEGMILISGGKFFMGSDLEADEERERPAHQVTLSAYCIDAHEVTVREYKACSDKGECKRAPTQNEWPGISARERRIYDPLCNIRDPEGRAEHPINCVDWELATAYCKAVGKRLPTEAEWEFATRGSDGRRYPWGDDAPTTGGHLNACGKECVAWGRKVGEDVSQMYPVDDGYPHTAPVGSFPDGASPFGVHDVVGNVWEWVSDWFAPYGAESLTDPSGAPEGEARVLRGGAWNGSDPAWVRPTFRFMSAPTLRSHGVGMRCAMPLEMPEP